jgi:hypothetical protein
MTFSVIPLHSKILNSTAYPAGWWLVSGVYLFWRKVLLASWWLVLIYSERKVLLAGG